MCIPRTAQGCEEIEVETQRKHQKLTEQFAMAALSKHVTVFPVIHFITGILQKCQSLMKCGQLVFCQRQLVEALLWSTNSGAEVWVGKDHKL